MGGLQGPLEGLVAVDGAELVAPRAGRNRQHPVASGGWSMCGRCIVATFVKSRSGTKHARFRGTHAANPPRNGSASVDTTKRCSNLGGISTLGQIRPNERSRIRSNSVGVGTKLTRSGPNSAKFDRCMAAIRHVGAGLTVALPSATEIEAILTEVGLTSTKC